MTEAGGEMDGTARMNAAVWDLDWGTSSLHQKGALLLAQHTSRYLALALGAQLRQSTQGAPIEGRAPLCPVPQPTRCLRCSPLYLGLLS